MRSTLPRVAALLAATAAFALAAAAPAAAEQAAYCIDVPSPTVGIGPRPMSTYQELCVPWPLGT